MISPLPRSPEIASPKHQKSYFHGIQPKVGLGIEFLLLFGRFGLHLGTQVGSMLGPCWVVFRSKTVPKTEPMPQDQQNPPRTPPGGLGTSISEVPGLDFRRIFQSPGPSDIRGKQEQQKHYSFHFITYFWTSRVSTLSFSDHFSTDWPGQWIQILILSHQPRTPPGWRGTPISEVPGLHCPRLF